MKKDKEPPPKDEPDSLERLADFTRKILQVPRSEITDNDDSDGMIPSDEPCPET